MAASPPTSPGSLPKAVLYYSPNTVASAFARLTLREKGYGDDELDLRVVDLSKAENLSLSYLRLSPKASVPTLVVPIQSTLSQDVASKYKPIADPVTLTNFLDSSRSGLSKTRSTSQRPAPSLSPATPEFAVTQKRIMEEMLLTASTVTADAAASSTTTDAVDQESLQWYNAPPGSHTALQTLSTQVQPLLAARKSAINSFIQSVIDHPTLPDSERPRASEKVKALWKDHLENTEGLLSVFAQAGVDDGSLGSAELKGERLAYYEKGGKAWAGVAERLKRVNKEVVGPFVFGDQLSLADLTVLAYLSHIALLAGISPSSLPSTTGAALIEKIEAHINAFVIPTLKLKFGLPRNYGSSNAVANSESVGDTKSDAVAKSEVEGSAAKTEGTQAKDSLKELKQVKLAVLWDALKERESWGANLKVILGQE